MCPLCLDEEYINRYAFIHVVSHSSLVDVFCCMFVVTFTFICISGLLLMCFIVCLVLLMMMLFAIAC